MQMTRVWYKNRTNAVQSDNNLKLFINKDELISTRMICRYSTLRQFDILIDLTVVDNPYNVNRFTLIYNLRSVRYSTRLLVKIDCAELDSIKSISGLFENAAWIEREVWDIFGVKISDHLDLRRILTDYGFEGHPIRKDYPLTGYTEVNYDESTKRVVVDNLELMQENRSM